ncbi:MAG: RidA family protein [Rikenellaceae bacterium]
MKRVIETTNAPGAVGPYSQAIEANGVLYASGQIGLDPETKVAPEGTEAQTHQVLKNIKGLLEAAGYTLNDVVKTTVLLDNIEDFAAMNAIYATYFVDNKPARSTYEVARLPLGMKIEIEVIATKV